ncbi:ATP-dependent DNA helicase [Nakamurella sp. PAMC28650]|uniref:ATP-dependent helicase n=1 Tax=Nakamurella sp. PAMC28650 TaxID=2762325 RepID=UPI00164D2056|nr:ATP-dependent DNA helicase [Nakamurella sp. PAMC28650]QNK80135.1 ATP-dependent helicase [Nakamurella sp. PAMC28650]
MPALSSVSYRFRPAGAPTGPLALTDEQRRVTGNAVRRLRVLAGPGTGKTATLVEAVADRIQHRGVPPEQILVLTFSRRAAAELSGRITRRLGLTTRTTLVRTLHSYAYSVVRAQAAAHGEPSPRLLAAGESDRMVRELLAGHATDAGGPWSPDLAGALPSPTFAAELREVLLRAAGQGIGPKRMMELGRRHKKPEWVAAGKFAREYQQVSDLRQGISGFGVALDQAELTAAALGALGRDDVLAAEQRRVRRIFVDEYQDVDPAQAALIGLLSGAADELVVFGDPDQSIYAFRGAEPTALRDIEVDDTVALTVSRRLAPAVLSATRRIAALLPGPGAHRLLRVPPARSVSSVDDAAELGTVDVAVFPTAAREAAYIADHLRRRHLLDGIGWGAMAILVRSTGSGLTALSRACAVAGVPLLVGGRTETLSAEPVVASLLTLLECGVDPALLTGEFALDLLASPLGDVDALGLRRLRRALRAARPGQGSSADLLAAVLAGAPVPDSVPRDLRPPLLRVRELVAIARDGADSPSAEQLLWALWRSCRLEEHLVAAVDRGGSGGQRADRALDAVLGLFAMASDLTDRLPLAGVAAFTAEVRGHQLPGEQDVARTGDAVALMSAHAAKGLEWDVVVVAGVQEGSWPDLRGRGSLLGGQEMLDLASDLPAGIPVAGVLAEERRLFYVAATRARLTLVCTGVLNQDLAPSRFLQEVAGTEEELTVEQDPAASGGSRADRRGLHLTDLVADLRRAVTDPLTPAADASAAAAHLAQLAAAGISGAHPDDWYGLAPRSTEAPPIAPGAEIRVSPSAIESLNTCALRAVLERRGGRTEPGQAQIEGIVVHAMAHGLAIGVPETDLREEIETFLAGQDRLPPWQLERTRRGLLSMLTAAQAWVRDNHPPRTLVGSEVELDLLVPAPEHEPGAPAADTEEHQVRLTGRVDWLSEKPDGTLVVTDFKTGGTVPTKAQAQANPQLASYQAAIAMGAFPPATRPGGAELVYLRSGSPKVLQQNELTATDTTVWLGTIRTAAAQLASAGALAQENSRCERCPVRTSCPLQSEGRQVRG